MPINTDDDNDQKQAQMNALSQMSGNNSATPVDLSPEDTSGSPGQKHYRDSQKAREAYEMQRYGQVLPGGDDGADYTSGTRVPYPIPAKPPQEPVSFVGAIKDGVKGVFTEPPTPMEVLRAIWQAKFPPSEMPPPLPPSPYDKQPATQLLVPPEDPSQSILQKLVRFGQR